MPSRFDIPGTLPEPVLQKLRDISGVFDVIHDAQTVETGPLRLSIPAIGLETPIYASASVANLNQGAVAMVNDYGALVLAGFGSVGRSVFAKLDEVRDGDLIVVTTLINRAGLSSERVRWFAADVGSPSDEPPLLDLDDVLLSRNLRG